MVKAASQSRTGNTSKFRLRTGGIVERKMTVRLLARYCIFCWKKDERGRPPSSLAPPNGEGPIGSPVLDPDGVAW